MRLAIYLLVTVLAIAMSSADGLAQEPCKGKFSYTTRLEGQQVIIEIKSRENSRAELVLFSVDNKGINSVAKTHVEARSEALLRAPARSTYMVQVTWGSCNTTLGGLEGISGQPSRK